MPTPPSPDRDHTMGALLRCGWPTVDTTGWPGAVRSTRKSVCWFPELHQHSDPLQVCVLSTDIRAVYAPSGSDHHVYDHSPENPVQSDHAANRPPTSSDALAMPVENGGVKCAVAPDCPVQGTPATVTAGSIRTPHCWARAAGVDVITASAEAARATRAGRFICASVALRTTGSGAARRSRTHHARLTHT